MVFKLNLSTVLKQRAHEAHSRYCSAHCSLGGEKEHFEEMTETPFLFSAPKSFFVSSLSRVPSSPPLSLNSSVSWDWAASYRAPFLPDRVEGKHSAHLDRRDVGFPMEAPALSKLRATMLRGLLWFFCEARTPVDRAMLRNIPSLKWAFHCPALVRLVYYYSQTFGWSRRILAGSRERTAVLVLHSFGQ